METTLTITQKEFYNQIRPMWIEQSGLDESAFAREISFAVQHSIKNPYLQKCTSNSVLRAVMNVAQIGSDAYELMKELGESMPIIGIHTTPHTVDEIGKAASNAADRDDYYVDQRKK